MGWSNMCSRKKHPRSILRLPHGESFHLFKGSIMFDLESLTQLIPLINDNHFAAVVLIVIILINKGNRRRYLRRARPGSF